ncbi:hypothetical protein GLX_02020 [Komagataeibacter medellinensis NBRC 3288]|uniref:Uncharacterized protein n=1 Tax=Komagataeibacter medellinensis (strain NBRC 3288 / BCRC 11682 / LMG 1693 / Kondo 51) TaxID=634177 RepID=G2I309_KOMMN|nr:hypothetical protein GLX_02020 [Komagataeibacter medellinensis NBRC 3288]
MFNARCWAVKFSGRGAGSARVPEVDRIWCLRPDVERQNVDVPPKSVEGRQCGTAIDPYHNARSVLALPSGI